MYTAKTFSIPKLDGISQESIDLHLGLYAGYVKHVNLIREQMLNTDEENGYARAEMQRRLGFEFGGMKNHEYYFAQFEGGHKELPDGDCKSMIEDEWESVENFVEQMKGIATTRGVGWAMCYIDRAEKKLVTAWIDEQHLGQLADVDIMLAIDMWEHSYLMDYTPSEKKEHVDAFFRNLNWEVVSSRV